MTVDTEKVSQSFRYNMIFRPRVWPEAFQTLISRNGYTIIEYESVKKSRTRLRQRMGLSVDESLEDRLRLYDAD